MPLRWAGVEPKLIPYHSGQFRKTYAYEGRVFLYDHHRVSSAELFVAAIKTLPDVTLVGTATMVAGGGSRSSTPRRRSVSKLGSPTRRSSGLTVRGSTVQEWSQR